jgi:hypothetical protein
MYQRERRASAPGRKHSTASGASAQAGSSTAAQKKKTRFGWNE